jgi:hypothetical protein
LYPILQSHASPSFVASSLARRQFTEATARKRHYN